MEYFEDRLIKAGHHEEFTEQYKLFMRGCLNSDTFYEWLVSHNVTSEEANAFIEMCEGF